MLELLFQVGYTKENRNLAKSMPEKTKRATGKKKHIFLNFIKSLAERSSKSSSPNVIEIPTDQYHDLILRDYLAADRTAMSNERSILAYIRTALTLIVSGASAIKFFYEPSMKIIGVGLIASGILTMIIGVVHYHKFNQRLNDVKRLSKHDLI